MAQSPINSTADALEASALPRFKNNLGEAAAPDLHMPDAITQTPIEQKSPAQWAYERIIVYIKTFEEQLDEEHEAAMGFAGSDQGALRIEGVGHYDPDILTFYGSDAAGIKSQLVQHVSQLNIMLRAIPKKVPEQAPLRIGFQLIKDLEENCAQTKAKS